MKIRYVLQGMLITLIIGIVIHVMTLDRISKELIHVKEVPLITKRFTSLNERIINEENETCKDALNAMLERVKKTYFANDVTIKEYYEAYNDEEKNFIDFYEDVNVSCKLENNDDIYFLVLSSLNYPNSIKNRYELRYEFLIRDSFNRADIYISSDEIGTYTTKLLELQIIDKLLKEVGL